MDCGLGMVLVLSNTAAGPRSATVGGVAFEMQAHTSVVTSCVGVLDYVADVGVVAGLLQSPVASDLATLGVEVVLGMAGVVIIALIGAAIVRGVS